MRTRFVNLRVPAGGDTVRPAQILVEHGRIAEIRPVAGPGEPPGSGEGDRARRAAAGGSEVLVDLEGGLVLPGVIDGHVHFDDPGFTHRETFESGTRAAAAGGVTCVVDMPCTTLPPVTSAANLANKLAVVGPKAHIDFMLWGGASDNALEDPAWRENLADVVAGGVASIKVYMLSGMDTFRDLSRDQLARILEETARHGIPVGVHAEDRDLVRRLTARLMEEGRGGPLDYAASRPREAEISAVGTMRDLCRETGARVHIVHLATGAALDLVAEARDEGLPLSAETCPHFLAFTDEDLASQGALLKTAPVVKGEEDRERLWDGLASGEIAFVATDHAAGQWPEEKETGSIWTDYGGVPGVELSLPYLYSEGVRAGRITLERLTELTAAAPAAFFGADGRKGRLASGLDADFAVLDDGESWTVRAADLHNLNPYTPLEGRTLTGRVWATYVRGRLAYRREADGAETFGPAGLGRHVRRGETA
ncbi:MAG: allantoinase AllB [Gemmatimonadota bacterium]